ncbi:extracellular solute-binding protein [Pseudooceanicola sp. 216_PA32_1]|uniref:Extracellular solute-binding protein n=1 Tax=Pseudooceanicola pacificus TaxID=2676438 RepID=A0A844W6H5_9RHOB|nr:extracellular solute-binding protein [Pseudooceanicola pacificus]MWB78665.1 extracellular solute-binding protein [Pseudooceanicola pacificus]
MTNRFTMTRRGMIGSTAALLASPYIVRPVRAQAAGEVIQCNFGGGVAESFQAAYGDLFTEATGIPFRIVEVPSTETALISNRDAPIYNSSYHSYSGGMKLAKMGVTEPLAIADYPVLQNVPDHLLPKIDDDHVAGMPIQFIFYGLAYNSQFGSKEDFASWQALADPKWAGQVTVTRPVYASLYDVPWYSKMLTGDQKNLDAGIEHYTKVSQNALTAYTSMAQNQQLLQRGDAVACAYYSSRIWDTKASGADWLDVVIPEEGALMIPYVFVLPKDGPYMEAAKEFLKFAGTAAPQEAGLLRSGTLPMNTTAKVDDDILMDRFGYTKDEIIAKTFNPDWAYIEETREDLIKRIESALG